MADINRRDDLGPEKPEHEMILKLNPLTGEWELVESTDSTVAEDVDDASEESTELTLDPLTGQWKGTEE